MDGRVPGHSARGASQAAAIARNHGAHGRLPRGFRNRKGDAFPEPKTLWIGLQPRPRFRPRPRRPAQLGGRKGWVPFPMGIPGAVFLFSQCSLARFGIGARHPVSDRGQRPGGDTAAPRPGRHAAIRAPMRDPGACRGRASNAAQAGPPPDSIRIIRCRSCQPFAFSPGERRW